MAIQLVNLCGNPSPVMRDGWTGRFAKIQVPFAPVGSAGFISASGASYSFPQATMLQNTSPTIAQTNMSGEDTFRKDCCSCTSNIAAQQRAE